MCLTRRYGRLARRRFTLWALRGLPLLAMELAFWLGDPHVLSVTNLVNLMRRSTYLKNFVPGPQSAESCLLEYAPQVTDVLQLLERKNTLNESVRLPFAYDRPA